METQALSQKVAPAGIISQYGNPLTLIGRKNAMEVWAFRCSDKKIRSYFNFQLRAPGGANEINMALAVLPKMKKAVVQAKALRTGSSAEAQGEK